MLSFVKKHFFILTLFALSLVIFAVNVRINLFRYNNFDFGKFDLGNMTQMVWNASQGNGLYLTDYFGTNLPRWSMSHVDPILYIFVPLFWVFPHALTLVFSQLALVIFSSLLIYKIALQQLDSKFAAFLLGFAYLINPSIGYLTAWTGFHGVTAVIPFFLAAFYVFEHMYKTGVYSTKLKVVFWLFLILTMMGKEQIPLYIFIYGIFILLFRANQNTKKIGISMLIVSAIWFCYAFFILIPKYADVRVQGYEEFAQLLDITDSTVRDVALPNYFLNRYEEFGTSYFEVAKNILLSPKDALRIFFGGDKVENFRRTFEPLAFLSFAYPALLALALPDLAINFLTSADGIGTSEITNHRISMIIPVLFISAIFGIKYLANLDNKKIKRSAIVSFLALCLFGFSSYTTHYYNNPVYLWLNQAVHNRVIKKVFAKTDPQVISKQLKVGDVVTLSELEDKDRECALKIVQLIPAGASVSGPDSLGAHLALRETYAIFPSLYTTADYVIVDVFAQKIIRILDLDVEIIGNVVEDLIRDENYKLSLGCGNYFVFKNVGKHNKIAKLPIQERFRYEPKVNLPFFQQLEIVDYELPSQMTAGVSYVLRSVYFRAGDGNQKEGSLDDYLMFTSFVNKTTGEIYQMANLPSFGIKKPEDWDSSKYYLEDIEVIIPDFVERGDYMVFIGMGNKIRTRSIYLGDTEIK